jgi:NAD(P)-dependent dehydrogenase (short-subunit alcohol dehydrogenase family)
VLAFARVVAKEHARDGVRCNVIAPSLIDTPANRAAMPDAIDKMVPPERIAATVKFLCSDESTALNGAVLEV